jgi:hypothetical protein
VREKVVVVAEDVEVGDDVAEMDEVIVGECDSVVVGEGEVDGNNTATGVFRFMVVPSPT